LLLSLVQVFADTFAGANYLAFDIIGDLAFGAPFGMIQAAKDSAPVPKSQSTVMGSYGNEVSCEVQEIPAVQILNGRGEYSMSMGVLPWYWRPFARQLPWYKKGGKDVKTLAGIAIMAVAKRLATPTDRNDLLSKLQAGKDDQARPKCSVMQTMLNLLPREILCRGANSRPKHLLYSSRALIRLQSKPARVIDTPSGD
jgi:benzoate 4-monooxygenase